MRPSYKTVLASLVATLALGAFAATSATAALPEFTGPITTEKPLQFTLTLGNTEFESPKTTIKCESGSGLGVFNSTKAGTAYIAFKGCTTLSLGKCNTSGAAAGEMITEKNLPVLLTYIKSTTKETGIVVNYFAHVHVLKKPPPPSPTFIGTIDCSGGTAVAGPIKGSVIAPVTPINTKKQNFNLKFSGSKGVQTPSEYENEKSEKETDGFGWTNFFSEGENMSLTSASTLTTGKETEIKA